MRGSRITWRGWVVYLVAFVAFLVWLRYQNNQRILRSMEYDHEAIGFVHDIVPVKGRLSRQVWVKFKFEHEGVEYEAVQAMVPTAELELFGEYRVIYDPADPAETALIEIGP